MIDDNSVPLGDNVREHPRKRSNIELNSSSMFCKNFTPPDPLVEGIIMRGFIYALTAPTGRGKTAIALHIAHSVALGHKLGDLEVEKGRPSSLGRRLGLVRTESSFAASAFTTFAIGMPSSGSRKAARSMICNTGYALERIRRAIHYGESERRIGEDWSVAKNYVRLLLHRMA
jgi:hypothetical protein